MQCVICDKPLKGKQKKFCSDRCTNIEHQNYHLQQERGAIKRATLIAMKGGKCETCGYNKNSAALCFHHTDPTVKEIPIDMRRCSNTKMETLLKEAAKCILLCHNCHMELHHPKYANET